MTEPQVPMEDTETPECSYGVPRLDTTVVWLGCSSHGCAQSSPQLGSRAELRSLAAEFGYDQAEGSDVAPFSGPIEGARHQFSMQQVDIHVLIRHGKRCARATDDGDRAIPFFEVFL